MVLLAVEDFFSGVTEQDLRDQVSWLIHELGLDDAFFAYLLHLDLETLTRWRSSDTTLPPESEQTLRNFWRMFLHLFSHLNGDVALLRAMFTHYQPTLSLPQTSPFLPPWGGFTMRQFLENGGNQAIDQVDCWVMEFHAGNPWFE